MLNKDICKQCVNACQEEEWCEIRDEECWQKGFVMCVVAEGETDINEDPPANCQFAFQHMILGQVFA